MEEIYFNNEAKDKLFLGVEKLYKAVSSTMGPNGNTVVIIDGDTPKITKDGVSVARSIQLRDPVENIGAELVRQAAEKTVDDAGDGTTTATVLAYSLIKNLREFNIVDINKALDEIIPKALEELKKNSRELKNEDIKHVASISANNDVKIGELIQQAFNFSNKVKVEESNNIEDSLVTVNGMQLDITYLSKDFINNPKKGTCEFTKPFVLILDSKIDKLTNLKGIIDELHTSGESLLIISEHVNEMALRALRSATINNNAKICVIKAPGFGPHRKDLLQDIADFTNAKVVTDLNRPISKIVLGKLESCEIFHNQSILIKDEEINIDDKIESLEDYSKVLEDYERDLIEKRIELLKAKVSIIKVGGKTSIEMQERKDRVDDAVLAVSSALEEGIVEGGGIALSKIHLLNKLYNSAFKNPDYYISYSLLSPFKTIFIDCINGPTVEEYSTLYNMFDQNIIDPLKVTRCALENAVSVARTILSTETVVLNKYLWSR